MYKCNDCNFEFKTPDERANPGGSSDGECPNCESWDFEEIKETELLDKEIKKPIVINQYGKASCLVCDCDLHDIGKSNYCPCCGNAIDWNRK